MPGPPPKPADQRRRRNAPLANTVHLPAEGRQGPPPPWPYPGRAPALWAQLWATPQAVMWERQGWTRFVARYARLLPAAEKTGARITTLAEVRQMEDRLGLTPVSMLRLRWEVVEDEVAAQRDERPATTPRRTLKAV
jgi:hypothetical protein